MEKHQRSEFMTDCDQRILSIVTSKMNDGSGKEIHCSEIENSRKFWKEVCLWLLMTAVYNSRI